MCIVTDIREYRNQPTTHAPCPDHVGQWLSRSTGMCSCGSAHSLVTERRRGYLAFDSEILIPMRAQISPESWNGFAFGLVRLDDLKRAWERVVDPMFPQTIHDHGETVVIDSHEESSDEPTVLPVITDVSGVRWVDTATAGWTTYDVSDDPIDLQCECGGERTVALSDLMDHAAGPCATCGAHPDYAHISRHSDLIGL